MPAPSHEPTSVAWTGTVAAIRSLAVLLMGPCRLVLRTLPGASTTSGWAWRGASAAPEPR